MTKSGDLLEMPTLGMTVLFRQTAAETNGALLEYVLMGRPRGFLVQGHVHPSQEERHEVVAGANGLEIGGNKRVYRLGESFVVPPDTPHRHFPAGPGQGCSRVELRPALRTEDFLARLAELDRAGQVTKAGWLKPAAAARVVLDFPKEGHASRPPVVVQRALATGVSKLAQFGENAMRPYDFVDEWDVRAPIQSVFGALADGRSYPVWWKPVYLEVESKGLPVAGSVSRQHFKGRLPYHVHTTSTIVEYDPPYRLVADIAGDLRGRGVWTLTERGAVITHVRFDWSVFADRKFLRVLTPVLRPLLRANHSWAIARAREGLEPYAQRTPASADTASQS